MPLDEGEISKGQLTPKRNANDMPQVIAFNVESVVTQHWGQRVMQTQTLGVNGPLGLV